MLREKKVPAMKEWPVRWDVVLCPRAPSPPALMLVAFPKGCILVGDKHSHAMGLVQLSCCGPWADKFKSWGSERSCVSEATNWRAPGLCFWACWRHSSVEYFHVRFPGLMSELLMLREPPDSLCPDRIYCSSVNHLRLAVKHHTSQ